MNRFGRDRAGGESLGLGESLSLARERRGLSIEQAAQATRIRQAFLLALEEEDFTVLPAPVFARGLLRTYASYLGLNPDDLVGLLDSHRVLTPAARLQPAGPRLRPGSLSTSRSLGTLMVVFAMLGLVYYLYAQYSAFLDREQFVPVAMATQPPTATAVPTSTPVPSPSPAAANLRPGPTVSASPTPSPVPSPTGTPTPQVATVEARFSGDCWVKVEVDGVVVNPGQTFKAGDRQVWTGRKFVIRFGNAGAVDIVLNGKPPERLGATGQVVNWTWTSP